MRWASPSRTCCTVRKLAEVLKVPTAFFCSDTDDGVSSRCSAMGRRVRMCGRTYEDVGELGRLCPAIPRAGEDSQLLLGSCALTQQFLDKQDADIDTVWLAQSGYDLPLSDEYLVKVEDANRHYVRSITGPIVICVAQAGEHAYGAIVGCLGIAGSEQMRRDEMAFLSAVDVVRWLRAERSVLLLHEEMGNV